MREDSFQRWGYAHTVHVGLRLSRSNVHQSPVTSYQSGQLAHRFDQIVQFAVLDEQTL